MTHKHFWVIAYDIGNDHRRQKVAKLLETYGTRCNYSVFECMLTETQLNRVQTRINKIITKPDDSILYYYLCKSCVDKRQGMGRLPQTAEEVIVV